MDDLHAQRGGVPLWATHGARNTPPQYSRNILLPAVIALLLAACGSAEERINKAVPIDREVEVAKAALDKLVADLPSDRKEALEAHYANQLKLRALECSAGYTPPALASPETIKEGVGNAGCFVTADAKLRQWLGMRRAGLLASMPPLRPVPSRAPAAMVASDRIRDVAFADAAGVALLQVGTRQELMDLGDGKTLRSSETGSDMLPMLSPNGRVSASRDGRVVQLAETETGEALATIDGAAVAHWAGDKGLVWFGRGTGSGKVTYFDWASGSESVVPIDAHALAAVIPVPNKPDTFVLLSDNRAATLALDCKDNACTPRLMQEAKLGGIGGWAPKTAVVGNEAFFFASRSLTRLQLDTLQSRAVSFDPMFLMDVVAAGTPDTLLLKGAVPGVSGGPVWYLYSISKQTLAKVDEQRLLSTRLVHAEPLRALVAIDGSKLAVVDDIPAAAPESVAAVINALQFDAQAAKLETFERLQAMRAAFGDPRSAALQPYGATLEPSRPASHSSSASSRVFPPGEAGLTEAVRARALRPGNTGDINAWKSAYTRKTGQSPGSDFDDRVRMMKVYVITGDLAIPSGLSGANAVVFVLNRGTPFPRGNKGHSIVLDVESGSCNGAICGIALQ